VSPRCSTAGGRFLSGKFNLVMEQTAEAGLGAAGAYTVTPARIGADFAQTPTFSVQGVFDPSRQFDLAGLALSVRLTDVTPVPEPGAGWLLLAGLPLRGAMLHRRRD
jgi:hypothetical protein